MKMLSYVRNFELLVAGRDWAQGFESLATMLSAFSQESEEFAAWCHTAPQSQLTAVFTRIASASTALLIDPTAELTPLGFRRLTCFASDLAHVFLVSGYGNADHLLEAFVQRGSSSADNEVVFASQSDARKFLLCSSIYGKSVDTLIALLRRAPQAALPSVLAALSAHITCDPLAQRNRNQLLDSLEIAIDATPTQTSMTDLHRAWTLCSYATTEHRHDVKKHLNQIILKWLAAQEVSQPQERHLAKRDRPKLLVACEVTGGGHVMSRCYEPFLEQLRTRFHVVTMVAERDLGDETVPWSDELIQFRWSQDRFGEILKIIEEVSPDVIYYPCIGMRLWTVIACNLRLAPLQIASLGHPATTNSACIDFMVGGKTTSGDDDCYSERVARLSSPGNLYRLNRGQESYPREIRQRPAPIRIAVCANMLKLNSQFLEACGEIADRSERSIEFCFMPNCIGLKYLVARQQVTASLVRRARFLVAPRHRCSDYLQNLTKCDLYFSPFPFGGENSTLDALLQGLPVVTLAGKQPHSRLDARVMETVGLPSWLITRSPAEYIEAAVKLINEDETRISITQQLLDTDIEQRFTEEHRTYADDFVQTLWSIYEVALADSR